MATYTITATQYITELTAKTGADVYNINGGTLIQDCDTRYAPNSTALTGPFLTLTVSATLGGSHRVTTEFTKLVPFNLGSGTVPAYGSLISQGSASGVLLCVMATRTGGAVSLGGAAMPATGYLKLRVNSPGFTVGLLSGITATATGAEEQGWIEVVGQEAGALNYARLGTMEFRGDWFQVGLTTGVIAQTIQLPHYTASVGTWYPGVEVETAPGSGVYQFWPNAGTRMTSVNCSTDTRSMFVHIGTTGICKFGQGSDATTCGYLPPSGCKVRIPSINLQNCLAASRNQNVEPNRTMGTRMETAFSNAGPMNVQRVTGAWYWNVVQPYSMYVRDLHTCDSVLFGECATAADIDNLHVGLSTSATEFASNAIIFQQFYNGGTIGTMSWLRSSQTATSAYPATLTNLYGGWTIGKLRGGSLGAPTAVAGSLYWNTCGPATIGELWTFAKRLLIQGSENLVVGRHVYADKCVGATDTTAQSRAIETVSLCKGIDITSIENWPGTTNTHPYLALLYCSTTAKTTLRNCGTAAAPYNAGTLNIMGYIFDDGGNNDDIKLQRNWTTALRLGLHGGTNTTKRLTSVNNYQVDASKTIGPQQLDSTVHGNRFNSGGVPSSYAAVYGNCMWDGFTGDTTTRAALIFAEKSGINPNAYVVTAGTPKFTGSGVLAMATAGDQLEYTWPWRILGWNGLVSMAATGTNQTTNHTYEYALDKDGTGFGAWKTLSNANLAAETGIDPVVGFIPKLRISCTVSSTLNQLLSLRFDGTTTLALQNAALYPLGSSALTLTGLQVGSSIAVFSGATVALGQAPVVEAVATTTTATLNYEYGAATGVVRIRKPGFTPLELTYSNVAEVTIPVFQVENKDGYGDAVYGRGPGTTDAFVTADGAAQRIDIGNALVAAEDLYDVMSAWQATSTGIRYPEAIRFDGRDLLLMGSWRLRRALAAYSLAGVDSSVVVDGSTGTSPDDEANGSVDIRAKAVRTFTLPGTFGLTPTDITNISAGVWSHVLGGGVAADAELVAARQNAALAAALSA